MGSPKAYEASQLAKKIDAAPKEELSNLYRKACLNPKLFKTLYDTFQGDSVSKAKIRQQAANLQVHPDSLDECVDLFTKSVLFASLGVATEQNGDVQFMRGQLASTADNTNDADDDNPTGSKQDDDRTAAMEEKTLPPGGGSSSTNRAKAQVEIKIDPSMDPEKLEKLLGVLKKYGQI